MPGKGKTLAKKLIKKGVSRLKKELKPDALKSRLKKKVTRNVKGSLSDKIKDGSKDAAIARGATFGVSKHGGRAARPDWEVGGSISVGRGPGAKRKKANKKIAKWKAEAAAGKMTAQQRFLALDQKIKSKK